MKIRKSKDSYVIKPEDVVNGKTTDKNEVTLHGVTSLPEPDIEPGSRRHSSHKKRVTFSPEPDRIDDRIDRLSCFTGDDDITSIDHQSAIEPITHNGLYAFRKPAPSAGTSSSEKGHRRTPSDWLMTGSGSPTGPPLGSMLTHR